MFMTPETENFDGLRRLLKLKRYEQPPPGYLNDFSQQVVAQIRANANVKQDDSMERLFGEVPWLQRLFAAFQAKPALAVSFGAAVCALLVGGVIYSESLEINPPAMPGMPGMVEVEGLAKTTPQPVVSPAIAPREIEAVATPISTNGSLNVSLQPGGSLFEQFPVTPQPVGFETLGNGN
jgi:hypothetical protein